MPKRKNEIEEVVAWAYDDGYGDNKLWNLVDEPFYFPTYMLEKSVNTSLNNFADSIDKNNPLSFIRVQNELIGARARVVGEYAKENGKGAIKISPFKHNQTQSKANLVASLGLLAGDKDNVEVDLLAMALPIEYFVQDRIAFLKNQVVKNHEIWIQTAKDDVMKQKNINIKDAIVTSQPQASIYSYSLDDEGKAIKNKSLLNKFVLIVDLGFGTLNILALNKMKAHGTVMSTTNEGVNTIYSNMKADLENEYDIKIESGKLPYWISEGQLEGFEDNFVDYAKDFYKDHAESVYERVEDIARDILDEVNHIVFTGGGTELLEDQLREAFVEYEDKSIFLGRYDLVRGLGKIAKVKMATMQREEVAN
jgi:hypothetical protein